MAWWVRDHPWPLFPPGPLTGAPVLLPQPLPFFSFILSLTLVWPKRERGINEERLQTEGGKQYLKSETILKKVLISWPPLVTGQVRPPPLHPVRPGHLAGSPDYVKLKSVGIMDSAANVHLVYFILKIVIQEIMFNQGDLSLYILCRSSLDLGIEVRRGKEYRK